MSQSTSRSRQLSFNDPFFSLNDRARQKIEKGWAGEFNRIVLPFLVDIQSLFEPLYASDRKGRPSTPTYLVLGYLLLQSAFGLTDQELQNQVEYNIAYQYALGTTSYEKQLINSRTLNRFRNSITAYEKKTGINLLKLFFDEYAKSLKIQFLGSNRRRRMDSIMVDDGARKLSRLQLAHVINRNALSVLRKSHIALPEELKHYLNKFDENQVTYHSSLSASEKMETAFKDSVSISHLYPEFLREKSEYRLLERFINEQIELDENGRFAAIRDGKTLTSTTLNNPAEPEATIRTKAGETNIGFVGNFAETVDLETNRKIIDSCDFKENIYSDVKFCADELDRMAAEGNTDPVVTDGAYISDELIEKAAANGIELCGTNLVGKETPDLVANFVLDEEAETVTCPNNQKADRARFDKEKENCSVSFMMSKCKGCPYESDCPLKKMKRVRSGTISQKQIRRAKLQRIMGTEEFQATYQFRNGVEAIPSQLRRNQKIDLIPARGFLRKKIWYVLALIGINTRRAIQYGLDSSECTLNLVEILVLIERVCEKLMVFTSGAKMGAQSSLNSLNPFLSVEQIA